jgi:hypothetical protein
VVASTVQKAAGHMATAFRHNLQPSPFHLKGSTQLHPFAKALFQAFNNVDPAAKRHHTQAAEGMFRLAGAAVALTHDSPAAIIAESSIVAFFFAMRSCERTTTSTPGETKTINLAGVMFRNRNKQTVSHGSPDLADAEHVSLTFKDQKNNEKNDAQSQQRTDDPMLCPVRRTASLVSRIPQLVPGCRASTAVNTIFDSGTALAISQEFLRDRLRVTCTALGGKNTFGCSASDIGTKSLRSGAAMALFLMNHSTERIMLLGR